MLGIMLLEVVRLGPACLENFLPVQLEKQNSQSVESLTLRGSLLSGPAADLEHLGISGCVFTSRRCI